VSLSVQYLTCRAAIGVAIGVVIKLAFVEFYPDFPLLAERKSMTITLYGLAKCSTCIKARAWLDAHGVQHSFVDYRDRPVAAATLKHWAEQLGGWEKLVNRTSMTWHNLPEACKTPADDAAWLRLIAASPALIRRPVAVDAAGIVSVAFSEKRYLERFG